MVFSFPLWLAIFLGICVFLGGLVLLIMLAVVIANVRDAIVLKLEEKERQRELDEWKKRNPQ